MRLRLKKLSSQVIVITGASSGIGLVTARMAARRGAKLVLVARNEEALKQLVSELREQGGEAVYCAVDVANESDMRRVAEHAMTYFGRIDTWINNAGVSIFGRNEEVSLEDKRRLFETNFWGMVHGSLIATHYMRRQGGALINIGSAFSDRAAPLQGIYAASKHAVKGFTDSLRIELEEEGVPISVTLIKPASVATTFLANAKNYMDVHPMLPPPVYAPELVAQAILHAAEHPQRDLYVGGAAKLLAMGGYYFPRLMDRSMQYLLFRLQRTDKLPRSRGQNNLHSAGVGMQERTEIDRHVRETSSYTAARMHPATARVLLVGGCLGLLALWKSHRNRVKGQLTSG
jgi:short-subunit dehydrogenase